MSWCLDMHPPKNLKQVMNMVMLALGTRQLEEGWLAHAAMQAWAKLLVPNAQAQRNKASIHTYNTNPLYTGS